MFEDVEGKYDVERAIAERQLFRAADNEVDTVALYAARERAAACDYRLRDLDTDYLSGTISLCVKDRTTAVATAEIKDTARLNIRGRKDSSKPTREALAVLVLSKSCAKVIVEAPEFRRLRR
jgi:hypothetical protein